MRRSGVRFPRRLDVWPSQGLLRELNDLGGGLAGAFWAPPVQPIGHGVEVVVVEVAIGIPGQIDAVTVAHVAALRSGNVQMFFPECNLLIRAGERDASGVPDHNAVVEVLPGS